MSRSTPEPLVDVRNLTKHFPLGRKGLGRPRRWIRAVDGVSFQIHPGETLGLVGESGCGKTTTGRAILRLVEPTGGEVRFAGDDVRAMDTAGLRRLRRRAQIVFQDPFSSLNPRMTVGAMLEEVLKVHRLGGGRKDRRLRIAELLERVGLRPEHGDRYPHEFSGGQRQRIGIARALAVEPDFIVFDEPVSALDVSVRAQVVNLMRDLQAEMELTYLFIAHDLALVEHLSDRVAVMYLGRIVEEGPAEELFRNPVHPYTRALLSAVPESDPGRVARRARIVLPGDVPSPSNPPPGCPFHPRCLHPGKDEECRRIVPSLEEVSPGRRAACPKADGGEHVALDRVGEVQS
jgi:oligopeptide/dipeptide ABC transporter ATP-binding protein